MSNLEVKIDGESMQAAIVQAVADSTMGEHIRQAIEDALKKSQGYGHGTILEQAAKSEINRMISIIVREVIEERKEDIRAMVTPLMTDEVLRQMSGAAIEVMLGNLARA